MKAASKQRTPMALGVALTLTVAALVAGCGSSNSNSSSGSTTPASGSATKTSASTAVPASIMTALKNEEDGSLFGQPPTTGPTPQPGKTVFIVACSTAINSCQIPAQAAQAAAQKIGWKATICNGQFTPTGESACVRQAVAAHVNGLIMDAVDCVNARVPLEQAKAAGIKVVSFYAMDCNVGPPSNPNTGQTPLFNANNIIQGTNDYHQVVQKWAAVRADYICGKLGSKARVIDFSWPQLLVLDWDKVGFENEMNKCPGARIVDTVNFTGNDLGPGLAQKVASAIEANPDANAISALNDGSWVAGVEQGLKEVPQSRVKSMLLVGGEGYAANLALLEAGKINAEDAFPGAWNGWAAVDTLNRVFHSQPAVSTGIGFEIIDRQHNWSALHGGTWNPPVNYVADYEKALHIS